ncbi:MAG: site-specific DNA-methyltransferase [Vicingaceae bacterium]|nr:site-specific DNA-methyltransferase [Vicingaceae bacterium]
MKLYETLEQQLKKEPNFVTDDGELKKWVVLNKAQNFDEELIGLLLDNADLKEKFFVKVKDTLVFNQSLFSQFLEQKNYLNDSYTQYKNKVGLTIDGKYLKQRNEVALVWPFKDCILEGGQSREEQNREEIFFNEVLAQDEITQLLEPKVLTNAKHFDKDGEKPLLEFNRDTAFNKKRGLPEDTITDNLIIKGNNLLTLHTLKEEFAGKVKLIYIDPPYNTDNGGFNYNDSFGHSAWMSFMKNRLEVAKVLLKKDGVILINSDEIEHSYLKILCDEVFGRSNFKGDFIWKKRKGGGNDSYFLALDHDYISVFTKDGSKAVHEKKWRVPYTEEYLKRYKEKDENGERYYWDTLARDGLQNPIVVNLKAPDGSDITLNSQKPASTIKEQLKSGHIKFTETKNGWSLHHRVYMPEGKVARSILDKAGTNKTAKDELVALFGHSIFKYPKPESLLNFIISLFTDDQDIVMDFFLGSGTTCAVAHKMKRQYIGVEQMEYIETVAKQRLVKVVEGEQGGISAEYDWQGGGSFVYLELKKYNQTFIDQIEAAKETETLLNIWEQMKAKSFLNYNVNIQEQEKHLEEFKADTLENQKQLLLNLLDLNQLYVNLSALDDKDFACTDEEKNVTKDFYQIKD